MQEIESAWSHRKEMNWLKKIGEWVGDESPFILHATKKDFLMGYLKSCKNRQNWGDIDKEKIMVFAQNLIDRLPAYSAKI